MRRTRVMASGIAALAAAATMLAGAGTAGAAGTGSRGSSGSLYFVRGVNIMVVPVGGGTARKITKSGTDSVTGMTIASGKIFWVTLTGLRDNLSFAAKNGGS